MQYWINENLPEWIGNGIDTWIDTLLEAPTIIKRTQSTPSQGVGNSLTYYGLFRKDAVSFTAQSALQDQVFTDITVAQTALKSLVSQLPMNLKNLIIIQKIPPPVVNSTADRWYVALN